MGMKTLLHKQMSNETTYYLVNNHLGLPHATDVVTMSDSLVVLFANECHKPKLVIGVDEALTPYHYRPSTILCRAISLYSGGGSRSQYFPDLLGKTTRRDQKADPLVGIAATNVAQNSSNQQWLVTSGSAYGSLQTVTLGIVITLGGIIEVGESGELASRLLWLLAKDLYTPETTLENTCQLFSHWVRTDGIISAVQNGDDQLTSENPDNAQLRHISRSHDPISCKSFSPWVAILVDLDLRSSAVTVKFDSGPDDPYLRM
ncbi:hypothetical protein EDC04DRAFT_2612040 [Pisolithus marmoratus]|nr:hypothetical protein EDC04DRAFT_2612040 [Pisolithus marmoratus]